MDERRAETAVLFAAAAPRGRRFVVILAPDAKPIYVRALLQPREPLRLFDSVQVKVPLFQAHFRSQVLAECRDRCCVPPGTAPSRWRAHHPGPRR